MQVRARLNGNMLTMRCDTTAVMRILTTTLRYTKLSYLATWQERKDNDGKAMRHDLVECFHILNVEGVRYVRTAAGFINRVREALQQEGYKLEVKDVTPAEHKVYPIPNWKAVKHYVFRPKQKETLRDLISVDRGLIHWATGTGKTAMIEMICQFFNRARILIVSKFGSTVDSIYDRLNGVVSGIGKHWSGGKVKGRRVMVYSSGCLAKALNEDPWDIVLADEVHELATDGPLELLGRFRYARMIGLSANHGDRLDRADFEIESLFGVPFSVKTYEEGVADGDIVPIEVHWRSVECRKNPAENRRGVSRERWGIWRNKERNTLIAEDAKLFPDDQVLITVKTLEHAACLKQLLPDFTMVYGGQDVARIAELKQLELLPPSFKPMTKERALRYRRQFSAGKLRKVIATSVWNRAVDFKQLSVLIRGEGTPTKIDSTQIPGRLSRTYLGKKAGFLIDYEDQFDDACYARALQRRRNYSSLKYRQYRESNPSHFRANNGKTTTKSVSRKTKARPAD